MAIFDRFTAVAVRIKAGVVPSDKDMMVTSEDGDIIAVFAANFFTFPNDWDFWGVTDADGWTAAHAAAESLKLPYDFTHWDIKDSKGITVAAVYAKAIGKKGVESEAFKEGINLLRKAPTDVLEEGAAYVKGERFNGIPNEGYLSAIGHLEQFSELAEYLFKERIGKLKEILERPNRHIEKI